MRLFCAVYEIIILEYVKIVHVLQVGNDHVNNVILVIFRLIDDF